MVSHSSTKPISLCLALLLLFSSCSSSTIIYSNPNGSNVFLNGEYVGITPYTHTDQKIVGSTTRIRLEKEGYDPLTTSFTRNEKADVGAIIGGLFVLIPFLWTMKYKSARSYILVKEGSNEKSEINTSNKSKSNTKAFRLRELKKLLDEDVITKEQYEKEVQKILDEKENN